MVDRDHGWSLTDAFQHAAIDTSRWGVALQGLADATGSRCGQLLGLGSSADGTLEWDGFNVLTSFDLDDVDPSVMKEANDPAFNPRVRAGIAAPLLEVLAEADFIDQRDHRRHPHYTEFARPFDIPFSCLTTLERRAGCLIGLAVLRSERQGHITDTQRALFAATAPFVRAAVRTQIALEGQSSALLEGVLDALSIPAFVCDRKGVVRVVTAAAECSMRRPDDLQVKHGRLILPRAEDARALDVAILAACAAGPERRLFQTLVVRGPGRMIPLVLDVIALPVREYELTFAPRVLVTSGGPERTQRRSRDILRVAYGLTDAEIDIACRLAEGQSPDGIAVARGVAVGTVRAQIKPLLAKFGVNRQAELVARLGRLGR